MSWWRSVFSNTNQLERPLSIGLEKPQPQPRPGPSSGPDFSHTIDLYPGVLPTPCSSNSHLLQETPCSSSPSLTPPPFLGGCWEEESHCHRHFCRTLCKYKCRMLGWLYEEGMGLERKGEWWGGYQEIENLRKEFDFNFHRFDLFLWIWKEREGILSQNNCVLSQDGQTSPGVSIPLGAAA